jgi:hypothetical protein
MSMGQAGKWSVNWISEAMRGGEMEPMLDFLVDERARRLRAEADEMRRARGRPARRPFRRPWRRHGHGA